MIEYGRQEGKYKESKDIHEASKENHELYQELGQGSLHFRYMRDKWQIDR